MPCISAILDVPNVIPGLQGSSEGSTTPEAVMPSLPPPPAARPPPGAAASTFVPGQGPMTLGALSARAMPDVPPFSQSAYPPLEPITQGSSPSSLRPPHSGALQAQQQPRLRSHASSASMESSVHLPHHVSVGPELQGPDGSRAASVPASETDLPLSEMLVQAPVHSLPSKTAENASCAAAVPLPEGCGGRGAGGRGGEGATGRGHQRRRLAAAVNAEYLAADLEDTYLSGGKGSGAGRQKAGGRGDSQAGRRKGGRGRGGPGGGAGGGPSRGKGYSLPGHTPSNGSADIGGTEWEWQPQHFHPPPPPPSQPNAPMPHVMLNPNSMPTYALPGGMPVPLVMVPAYPHAGPPHPGGPKSSGMPMQPMVMLRNPHGMAMHGRAGRLSPNPMMSHLGGNLPPSPIAMSSSGTTGVSPRPPPPPPPPDAASAPSTGMTPRRNPLPPGMPKQLDLMPPGARRGLHLPGNGRGSPGSGVPPRNAGGWHPPHAPLGPQALGPYSQLMYFAFPAHQAHAGPHDLTLTGGMQHGAAHPPWEASPGPGARFPGAGGAPMLRSGGSSSDGPMHGRGNGRGEYGPGRGGRGGREWQRNSLENGAARGGRSRRPNGADIGNFREGSGPLVRDGTFHRHLHKFDIEPARGGSDRHFGNNQNNHKSHNHHHSSNSKTIVSNHSSHNTLAPAPRTPDRDGITDLQQSMTPPGSQNAANVLPLLQQEQQQEELADSKTVTGAGGGAQAASAST
jgi:hypothetical protein